MVNDMTKNQLNDLVEYLKSLRAPNMKIKIQKKFMQQTNLIKYENHEKNITEETRIITAICSDFVQYLFCWINKLEYGSSGQADSADLYTEAIMQSLVK